MRLLRRNLTTTFALVLLWTKSAVPFQQIASNGHYPSYLQAALAQTPEISKLSLASLKERCRNQGLKVSGNKTVLAQRILEAFVAEDETSIKTSSNYARISDADLLIEMSQGTVDDFPVETETENDPRFPVREQPNAVVKDFGLLGHDYSRSIDDSTDISYVPGGFDTINRLLANRLSAKLARNFGLADDIRSELLGYGISTNDGTKNWRADGRAFAVPVQRSVVAHYSFVGRVQSSVNSAEVEAAIAERSRAKVLP